MQHPHSFLLQSFSAWQLIWGYVCTKDVIQEGLQLAEMQICKQAVLLPTNLVFHRAMNSVKEFLFHIFVASVLKWKILDVEKFLILPCYFFKMYLVLLVFWHAMKLWQLKIVILHNVADFGLFFCLHPSCSLVHPMHRLLHCKYWFLILSPAAFRPQRSIGVKHIC